jgi:hypothetical protein
MDVTIEREAEWGLMGSSVGTAKTCLTELAVPLLPKPQFDELDRLTHAWAEDHKRQTKAPQKGSRTRHS